MTNVNKEAMRLERQLFGRNFQTVDYRKMVFRRIYIHHAKTLAARAELNDAAAGAADAMRAFGKAATTLKRQMPSNIDGTIHFSE